MLKPKDNEIIGLILPYLYEEYGLEKTDAFCEACIDAEKIEDLAPKYQVMIKWAETQVDFKTGKEKKIAKSFNEMMEPQALRKYNKYHDAKGRFSTAQGAKRLSVKQEAIWAAEGEESSYRDHMVKGKDGKMRLSPERQKLYEDIIRGLFDGVEKPEGTPEAVFMGGGGGSGKSYAIDSGFIPVAPKNQKKAVHINSDDIKSSLKEYNDRLSSTDEKTKMSAAGYVQQESSIIARAAVEYAMDLGYNVVFDGTASNPADVKKQTKKAKKCGMTTKGYYINAPIDVAVEYALSRYTKEGRYVDPYVIINAHKNVSKNFEKVYKNYDYVSVINNDRKNPLEVIFEYKNGERIVKNEAEYKKFLDKANYER